MYGVVSKCILIEGYSLVTTYYPSFHLLMHTLNPWVLYFRLKDIFTRRMDSYAYFSSCGKIALVILKNLFCIINLFSLNFSMEGGLFWKRTFLYMAGELM